MFARLHLNLRRVSPFCHPAGALWLIATPELPAGDQDDAPLLARPRTCSGWSSGADRLAVSNAVVPTTRFRTCVWPRQHELAGYQSSADTCRIIWGTGVTSVGFHRSAALVVGGLMVCWTSTAGSTASQPVSDAAGRRLLAGANRGSFGIVNVMIAVGSQLFRISPHHALCLSDRPPAGLRRCCRSFRPARPAS